MDKPLLEIIARAYDREEAAQMGEPDPWTDPEPIAEEVSERLACAQCVIEALEASGYRILPPGALDPETLGAAAKVAEQQANIDWQDGDGGEYGHGYESAASDIAIEIRAMDSRALAQEGE